MTKTIIGRSLTVTAIAVLMTSLTLVATIDEAKAVPTGTSKFKCRNSTGSFFPPPVTAPALFSSAGVRCTFLSTKTSMASILMITGAGSAPNCIALATSVGVDAFAISRKGYVTFSMEVEQCFFDSAGAPASPAGAFCGAAAGVDPWTSVATGTYAMTGGLVRGQPVLGGTGTVTSTIDHCAMAGAPYGNSLDTVLKGDITLGPKI